ncbi:hypothetical protein CPC08DRAFT_764341 [Agrocybe pediades]|nr:hypothetical protein CPC08DRAFT_764341 [Agrocybe pediades]
MSSSPSEPWSPQEGTTTFTGTFSPTGNSYTSRSDTQRFSSDGEDSAYHTRRLIVSPSPSHPDDDVDDIYEDTDSLDEVDASLNNLEEEFDDTEQALTEWSHSPSYSSAGPTFSSATGTFTYSGSYTGSPSFVSLPTFSPRSPPPHQPLDPRIRLSRITEKTEESRPNSGAFSASGLRTANPATESTRRSAYLGGGTPSHSRSSTDPSSDRTLPPPGRLSELRAVFEPQSSTHSRTTSTPGYRSTSPMFGLGRSIATSYGTYSSRPSSPSKSASGSSGSYTSTDLPTSLLSPPPRPATSSGVRSTTPSGPRTATNQSYSVNPSTFTNTNTWNTHTNTNPITPTGSYTTPTETRTYTNTDTFDPTTITASSGLRRPQTSPRSPLASVRNIVALWKERTPTRPEEKSAPGSVSSVSPPENVGLYGVRRRVEGARARLRESRTTSNPTVPQHRPASQDTPDNASIRSGRSGRSGGIPPAFDMNELSNYAQSKEPPTHIGQLWYLNVHASPPYRWQRCQALLYPHMLLLSWLAPGGGRGIVALDLLNCTSVQSAPSPTHPSARDDVGTMAAMQQNTEGVGQSLMETLVPFHMLYADGVERLAAESLLERQKWVNRLWETVNRPIVVPDSVSVTRSPTGSIRTIMSVSSTSSTSSAGSRSTFFVPPLSSLPDISDFNSHTSGLSRQSSIISSHHTRTVDDTVIQNQEYIYPGDPRVITPTRGSSLRRRSGSMTDLDDEFKSAVIRARGTGGLFGSPVTISSGSSLGKNIFVTPPPSVSRVSDRSRSDVSDENFFSAGSTDSRTRSTYTSTFRTHTPLTSTSGLRTTTGYTASPDTRLGASTLTSSYALSDSGSYISEDNERSFADSPSTLSRRRAVRHSRMSGYQTDGSGSQSLSDKENESTLSAESGDGTRTPTGSYVSRSAASSLSGSGSYSYDSRSRTPTGSYSGSYSGSERSGSEILSEGRSYTDSYTHSGSYTPASGSFSLQRSEGASNSLSSSGVGGHTPISSSETGYDICPSSDFTDMTRPTITESDTATPFSASEETLSVVASEKYVTASQGSTEFATAIIAPSSPRASIISFESLITIPGSEYYETAETASTDYRTASDPGGETEYSTASEPSEPSAYITADPYETDLEEIPSHLSTPTLSSLKFSSDKDEERSEVIIPSVVPSIRSPSLLSDLLPEEIPLPHSVVPSVSSPSTLSDLLPEEIPLPQSVPAAEPIPLPTPVPLPEIRHLPTPQPVPRFDIPEPVFVPTTQPSPLRERPLPATPPQQETPRAAPIEILPPLPPSPPSPPLPPLPTSVSSSPLPPTPLETPLAESPEPLASLAPSEASDPPLPPVSSPSAPSGPSIPLPSPSPSPSLSEPSPSSPSLTPSPSPLDASIESGADAPTPTTFNLPPPTESEFDQDIVDEETISLSLLSSLPSSSLGSTSVLTPTSLEIASPSTASTLPPTTVALPASRPTSGTISLTESSLSSSEIVSSVTQTSSSLVPHTPRQWATATDISYESSILMPSPSTRSIALHEPVETSYETSFFRPSGSPSSIGRMSTIPASISPLTSAPPQSPLPSLTPVPALPPSLPSLSDVATPTSLDFSSETSSSLGRTLSTYSTASRISQSSLSSSIFDSGSEIEELEEIAPSEIIEVSTEPSLLSTVQLLSPTPTPSQISIGETPEVSLAVSISTPQGSGATEQSSLRTVPSLTTVTERDLGRDLDLLADEIRTYDQARGLENQEIADNVRALRDELHDLAQFLQRTPPPSSPVVVPALPPPVAAAAEETSRRGVQLTDRPVGGSSILSSIYPQGLQVPFAQALSQSDLSRSNSLASYLSSHHSDDYIFEEADMSVISPEQWPTTTEESESLSDDDDEDEDTESSSSPESESVKTPSVVSSEATARPQIAQVPEFLEQSLKGIQDQLRALEDGQAATRDLIDALGTKEIQLPEDHTPELTERLNRIEDLIRNLENLGHPRGPEIVQQPSPAPTTARAESISESSDSLDRLRNILDRLANPAEEPRMPVPVTARAGPSVAQQLESILSPPEGITTATGVIEPPRVVPFTYRPTDRGSGARSTSPISIHTLPARPVSIPYTRPEVLIRYEPRTRRDNKRGHTRSETGTSTPFSAQPLHTRSTAGEREPRQMRNVGREPSETEDGPIPRRPQTTSGPIPTERTPRAGPPVHQVIPPLYPVPPRSETAPSLGRGGQPSQSWYRPPRQQAQQPQQPGQKMPAAPQPGSSQGAPLGYTGPSPSSQQRPAPTYIPMPAGPTVVQLPPLFDSLMEILRENRLAQLATVDQQRELMRYMRGLNEWLERDVHDRQSEIRGVVARVEQLGRDLHGIQMQGLGRPSPSSSGDSSSSSGETEVYTVPGGVQMPRPWDGLPSTFQPYPGAVIPPVIPDTQRRTPPAGVNVVFPGNVYPPPQGSGYGPIRTPYQGIPPPVPTAHTPHPVPGPMQPPTVVEPFEPPPPPGHTWTGRRSRSSSTGTPRAQHPQTPVPVPPRGTYSNLGPGVHRMPTSSSSSISGTIVVVGPPEIVAPVDAVRGAVAALEAGDQIVAQQIPQVMQDSQGRPRYPEDDYPHHPSEGRTHSMQPPTVHVISPSVASHSQDGYDDRRTPQQLHHLQDPHQMQQPQQQPTIIINQPPASPGAALQPSQQGQAPIIIHSTPSHGRRSSRHSSRSRSRSRSRTPERHGIEIHPSMGGMPMQPSMGMGGMPMQPSMGMGGMPMQPSMGMGGMPMQPSMGMGGMPMQPTMPGVMMQPTLPGVMMQPPMSAGPMPMPMGTAYTQAPPVIIQPSRSSSRSSRRSRSRRGRSPERQQAPAPAAPVIITGSHRSRSRSHERHHTPQPPQMQMPMQPGVTFLPSQQAIPMMPGGPPVIMRSSSSSSGRRRSHSPRRRDEPTVVVQQPAAAPTMIPIPSQAPTQAPGPILVPGGMSMPGLGMPGMPPVVLQRSRSHSRSRSRSPRRDRAPTTVVLPPTQHDPSRRSSPRRYHSRSRSRSPRRHHSRSRSRSRSPRRHHSRSPTYYARAPTVPVSVIPPAPVMLPGSHYPTTRRYSSPSPTRHHPAQVTVVSDPHGRGRSRSPPPHAGTHRYYSPERRDTRYTSGRRSPVGHDRGRVYSRAPSYDRRVPYHSEHDRGRYYSPPSRYRSPVSRSLSPRGTRSHSRAGPYRRSSRRRSYSPESRTYSRDREYRRHPASSRGGSRPRYSSRSISPQRRHYPSRSERIAGRRSISTGSIRRHPIAVHRSRDRSPLGSRSPPRRTRRRSARRTSRSLSPVSQHVLVSRPGDYVIRRASPSPTRSEKTIRVTVPPGPSRRADHGRGSTPGPRPPTQLSYSPPPEGHLSRVPTLHTGERYSAVPSRYEERHSPPAVIPVIASDVHDRPASTAPSEKEQSHVPRVPSSQTQPTEERQLSDKPADVHRVSDAPTATHISPAGEHHEPATAPRDNEPAAAPRDREPEIHQPPPRHATATPFDFRVADESRGQLEELNAAANRLHLITGAAEEAEDQRELEFRTHEDHREELFLQNEERRNQEARERAAGIWSDLETRLAALPPPVARSEDKPVSGEPGDLPEADRESIRTISAIATQAASQHAADVMETVRLEREDAERERAEAAREREMLLAELRAEKDRVIEEKDARIRALEEELQTLRGEFEAEKQQRVTEEAEMRERDRAELAERDEYVRAQLGDITNLVQDQRDMYETKKALMEARWQEKQGRRQEKDAQMIELRDIMQKIHDDMEADREKAEQEKRESKEALEKIIEDLRQQNAEQRELLQQFSESWRSECERHHEETISVVKSTANEQVTYNVQGYLDDFSRALAAEVRMLLGEVGKIREERRALQHEIGDLLCMKAKYGPGGEYEPDWKPPGPPAPPPVPPPEVPPEVPPTMPPVKPAWRTVHPRPKKKKKSEQQQPVASTSAPVPPAMTPDLRRQLAQSWATWQPDRNAQMTPPSIEPTLIVPGRETPGLFGPRTPTGSFRG